MKPRKAKEPIVVLVGGVWRHDLTLCPCRHCSFWRMMTGHEAIKVAKRSNARKAKPSQTEKAA